MLLLVASNRIIPNFKPSIQKQHQKETSQAQIQAVDSNHGLLWHLQHQATPQSQAKSAWQPIYSYFRLANKDSLSFSERGKPTLIPRLPLKTPSASPGQARSLSLSRTAQQASFLEEIIKDAETDPEPSLMEFRKGHSQPFCADLSYTEGSHALRCRSWL